MVQNHKAHEGDVLSLSVYHYIDQSTELAPSSPSVTTLIVSGGVDAKVGKLLIIFLRFLLMIIMIIMINK